MVGQDRFRTARGIFFRLTGKWGGKKEGRPSAWGRKSRGRRGFTPHEEGGGWGGGKGGDGGVYTCKNNGGEVGIFGVEGGGAPVGGGNATPARSKSWS